ncbi:MAG: biotin/lipoyl-binding protein, partial [Kiloniellales bacterium]|nr:biotin/lipoyl-binding protein [Kiloniellales bacterium]
MSIIKVETHGSGWRALLANQQIKGKYMTLFDTTERTAFVAHATAIVRIGVLIVVFLPLLMACEEEHVEFGSRARTIKAITVADTMSGRLDRYPGIVQAVDTSSISFEVSGNTREVNVNVGDRFQEGEVLATLDDTPFQLNVQGAEAALAKAR